jgi:hypothetical protein
MNLKEFLGDKYKDGITLEELIALDVEAPKPPKVEDSAAFIELKESFRKASSDAAELKRQLQSKMTEQERAETEASEKQTAIEKELAELRRVNAVNENTSKFVGLGYELEDAKAVAIATLDGDTDKIMELMKKHEESVKTTLKKELMDESGKVTKPAGGAGGTGNIDNPFKTDDLDAQSKLFKENPEQAKALAKQAGVQLL